MLLGSDRSKYLIMTLKSLFLLSVQLLKLLESSVIFNTYIYFNGNIPFSTIFMEGLSKILKKIDHYMLLHLKTFNSGDYIQNFKMVKACLIADDKERDNKFVIFKQNKEILNFCVCDIEKKPMSWLVIYVRHCLINNWLQNRGWRWKWKRFLF